MPLSRDNKLKIKNFLKVNLETLQGNNLSEFMEKYDIREASPVEMMLLDHGCPGQFVAFKNQSKDSYFVTTYEMLEKILFLETLDPTNNILSDPQMVRIN